MEVLLSAHIIIDKSKFIRYDDQSDPSKHIIELEDGSRFTNLVVAKGDAKNFCNDCDGCTRDTTLKDALCIPSFHQDIFSVQAAAENGASIYIHPNNAFLNRK